MCGKIYYVVLKLKRMPANCMCFVVCQRFFCKTVQKPESEKWEKKPPEYQKVRSSLTIFIVKETNYGRAVTDMMPRQRAYLHGRGQQSCI